MHQAESFLSCTFLVHAYVMDDQFMGLIRHIVNTHGFTQLDHPEICRSTTCFDHMTCNLTLM